MKGWPLDLVILGSRQAPPWMKLRSLLVGYLIGSVGHEGRERELTLPSRHLGRGFGGRDQEFGGGGCGRKAVPEGV